MGVAKNTMESMEIRKVLITGSEGYIGSVLTKKLLENNYEITGLDTNYYRNSVLGKRKTSYRFIKDDIRTTNIDLSSFDAIVHLAALSNDPLGELNPNLTEEINHKGTIRLARIAKSSGVKRFIFSSSCSIYGIANFKLPVKESSPINPLTAYAKSKKDAERELINMSNKNFCVGILRNSTVYGYSPVLRTDLVVNDFVTTAFITGKIIILSDGSPWRPLIDIRDLADIFILFLKADSSLINGEVFNVGFNDSNYQVKEIASKVRKAIPTSKVIIRGKLGNDSRSYKVSFSKLHKIFPGLRKKWDIDKSILDLIRKLKEYKFGKIDFENKKYVRLECLKELISRNIINDSLYFINK